MQDTPDHRRDYRRRMRRSDAMVAALWASAAAALALFLAYGGAGKFGTVSDAITSVGIIAGLIGTDFILVMIVLAARIPIIDRTVGHDRAIAVHRSLGKPALYLLLAHAVLLIIGYGMASGINPIAEIAPMLAIPDLPLAFIGIGLLIAVVITSLVAVRRKFSYEGWHLVHLLSYIAVLVAVPHQLSVGGILAGGTFERAYWLALYIIAFGSIATFRFAEPLISSIRHRLRVRSITQIAPGVVSIDMSGRRLRSLHSAGGQFFIWRFWTGRTWWHSHPISLSSLPSDATARITVRNLGTGSNAISRVPVGTAVWFEGPYGIFTDAGRTAPKLAIAVAGIGITPVRAFLEDSDIRPGEATILLRASTTEETYLWDEVIELARRKGATVYTMVGRRSTGSRGWMPAQDDQRGVTLKSIFPELHESDLYVCGPTAWLDLVEAEAVSSGIPSHQLHTERFDW
ncbi:ferric reductase-like transmembrane domain-containing protein [Lacisediminihabitans sp. G11-30]|uniref:Ferric reductase-like transmembrane domain-containing protein n=2 Tax=Lacisediminihabitans changchengi TaxID=2787634 RepID=A0A934SM50_9MICO|nr:ferric reductase-like transmembrane domain-containing protein [Lacisediminihabitans changchengi]MBK4347889.1 ferric reductase-like transmembrane domain-containing protein [Lacisediminihabitans changchengi]